MTLTPTMVWVLIGAVLCLSELIVPTAFVASVLGLSAFGIALIAGFTPLALQIALWIGLSTFLVLFSRRFVRQRAAKKLDAVEAETLTEIPPGQTGRVLYEGNSWAARCEDQKVAIAPHQKVYVVARQGTTLIVMPHHILHP